eukprot:6100861-Pyramimonas_sp.AAC.1
MGQPCLQRSSLQATWGPHAVVTPFYTPSRCQCPIDSTRTLAGYTWSVAECTQNAPGMYAECTQNAPGMYPECTRNVPSNPRKRGSTYR